jgi:hypothetical protein
MTLAVRFWYKVDHFSLLKLKTLSPQCTIIDYSHNLIYAPVKEMSISYEFSIIFEILVHSVVPHMACINDYMYITLRMLSLSGTGI